MTALLANEHATSAARAIAVIRDISEVLLRFLSVDALMAELLEALETHFQLEHTMIAFPEGDALVLVAARGEPAKSIGARIPIGVGLAGVAAQRQRTVRIGNMRVNIRYMKAMMSRGAPTEVPSEFAGLTDADSRIATPLVVNGELIAVLVAESLEPAVFSAEDAEIFELLTSQIAAAIRNARATDALEVARREAVAAHEETEAALTELRGTQAALIQSEKLASVGQLAAGIAHEVNTPLGAILASVAPLLNTAKTLGRLAARRDDLSEEAWKELLCGVSLEGQDLGIGTVEAARAVADLEEFFDELGLDDADEYADMLVETGLSLEMPGLRRLLEADIEPEDLRHLYRVRSLEDAARTIQHAALKAKKVVLALKSYVHRPSDEDDKSKVLLQASVDTVLTMYQNLLKHGVEVEFSADADWRVVANPDQLMQVWTNILHNAIQAMSGRGRIRIRISGEGSTAYLDFSNDGPPIPESVSEKLFEPFFTTKPSGQGTGLGLHLCAQIVEAHGGRLTLLPHDGWTTFRVTLPGSMD